MRLASLAQSFNGQVASCVLLLPPLLLLPLLLLLLLLLLLKLKLNTVAMTAVDTSHVLEPEAKLLCLQAAESPSEASLRTHISAYFETEQQLVLDGKHSHSMAHKMQFCMLTCFLEHPAALQQQR